MTQYEQSARDAGWFQWFGVWLHAFPWADDYVRPFYIIGSARDVCLLQGPETGEGL